MGDGSKKKIVSDNIEKIIEWLSNGMTMESIAKALGVCKTTIYKYLKECGYDLDSIKNARFPCVQELENTMFMSAKGYERKVKKYQKVKRCLYNDQGKKQEEWEEMVEYEETQYYPPDTTAGIFLLKNWANYMNEPRAMEMRRKEIELSERKFEASNW